MGHATWLAVSDADIAFTSTKDGQATHVLARTRPPLILAQQLSKFTSSPYIAHVGADSGGSLGTSDRRKGNSRSTHMVAVCS